MTTQSHLTREQWLEECAGLIMDELIRPAMEVRPTLKLKLSVGYAPNTKAGALKKTLGVCFASKVSGGGYNEIFITPEVNDSLQILETLVHEIIHAVDDCQSGHGPAFKRMALQVGLTGKMTETVAGPRLREYLAGLVRLMGDIPHASLNLKAVKRQTNRNLKVWCGCGFKFNTSRTQIGNVLELHGRIQCPACYESMQFDF